MGFAIFSLAKLLEFAFARYPVFVWAFFFGLILASVYYIGKRVNKWNASTIIGFIAGAGIAAGVSFLSPSVQNDNPAYLFLCGMLAISAMILPGISGSFILILLGNYELVVIEGVGNLHFSILMPFAAGCGIGLLAFSYFLSFLLKRFKDVTISTLTGFILGSLLVIWPWKNAVYRLNQLGEPLMKDGEPVIFKYERFVPHKIDTEVAGALLLALLGMAVMWYAESKASKSHE
jgi:putative membrane protein